MVTYAYLRVSTNQQDVDNQRHGILQYANQKSLGHLELNVKPAEVRSFLYGQLPPEKTQDLRDQILKIGIPL